MVLLIPGLIVAFVSIVAGITYCICYGRFKRCGRVPVMLNKGKQFMEHRIVWGVVTPILMYVESCSNIELLTLMSIINKNTILALIALSLKFYFKI